MAIKKIMRIFSNGKYIILIFFTPVSCLAPAPPKYIEYKIIESVSNSKDFLVIPTYNYNYITSRINSNIKIINISNENKKIDLFKYFYMSKNYNICIDSFEVMQEKLLESSSLNVKDIEMLPKETINIKMLCSKNALEKVILENDTVNLSIQIQNDNFKYKFIPIRK